MKKVLFALALTTSTLLVADDALGAIVGGAIGGVIGNQFGGGNGKVAATIAGATLGTIIGSSNQRVYTNERYSRSDDYNEYPTRVVYREIPQQVVYTQPQVVYVYTDREPERYRRYCRKDSRYGRDYHHKRWHDDD